MTPFTTAFFFILAAALGFQARIIHAIETKEVQKAKQGPELQAFHMDFAVSSDCCFSYTSWIRCSNFVYYFSTSGGCINPGIIFVTKKRNQICANPSNRRVQECIKRLRQTPKPGNKVIA